MKDSFRTMHRLIMTAAFVLQCFVMQGGAYAAEDPADGDVKNLRIGMQVGDIHQEDYRRISCAMAGDEQAIDLVSIDRFKICRIDSRGLIPLRLHYAPIEPWASISDRFDGTKIAGHPVNLWIDVDSSGHVQSIRAETDETANRYLRKKAFLLSLRVKARYGRDNWQCERSQPHDGKLFVGGMFIDEVCAKDLENRRVILHTSLYRAQGQELKEFVGLTELQILGVGVAPIGPDDRRAESPGVDKG